MLKIKDNVDLKELEKYGYLEGNKTINVAYGYYGKYWEYDYDKKINDYPIDLIEIGEDKIIRLTETSRNSVRGFEVEDDNRIKKLIKDLINDRLVEKVEGEDE